MKKQELVNITFCHNKVNYTARVQKYSVNAIILPNKTVLITTVANTRFKTTLPRGARVEFNNGRQIFDIGGHLNTLKLLYKPGNWDRPVEIHFPITFAEII